VVSDVTTAAQRVADAASGVPSVVDLAEWSHGRLRAVVGALAQTDGYQVVVRAGGSEGDLSLVRTSEERVSVIVMCAVAAAGPVSAKRLRELYGTITLEEVGTGWFVAVGGFSAEARVYAQEHGLSLIGKEGLREQLRALTERDLAHVLARRK
jgi:methylmalonyl-CoA mutase cobalamin-binding subunit